MKAQPSNNADGFVAHSIDSLVARGFGRTNLFRAIREGKLVARKIGRRTIVTEDDLRRYVESLPLAGRAK